MTEQAKKFAEALSADEALQTELKEMVKDTEAAEQLPLVIEFAKKKGYELTKEDFIPDKEDINLTELDTVAGSGGCGCAAAGGGGGDGLVCVCVGLGVGHVRIGGKVVMSQGACECFAAGAGATRRH